MLCAMMTARQPLRTRQAVFDGRGLGIKVEGLGFEGCIGVHTGMEKAIEATSRA